MESYPGEDARWEAAAAIREVAAHIHAAEARLATMVADFTADGHWNASGDWRSIAHWLIVNCGYTTSEARALQNVATKSETMPTVMGHALAGEISLQVAAQIARVATPDNENVLARVATSATPPQVSRVLADYRTAKQHQPTEPATEPAAEPSSPGESPGSLDGDSDDAFWRTWHDEQGNWRVAGKASAETGALLDQAYAAATTAAGRSNTETNTDASGTAASGTGVDHNPAYGDTPNRRPRVGDVLRGLADLALDAAARTQLRGEGGEHFRVNVLIDIDTLVSGIIGPDSICRLESGPHISPSLVHRLAEEGTLQILWHQRGVPLKLGPEVRFANRDQRRMLRFRDRGCAVPGCDAQRHLHAHHVVHHPDGPTDLDNLVLLCSFHHRRIHQSGWTVTPLGGQRFEFRDTNGDLIESRAVTIGRQPDGEQPPDLRAQPPRHRHLALAGNNPRPTGSGPLTYYARDVWTHALLTATA